MNDIIALWPYFLINTALVITWAPLYMAYRRTSHLARQKEEKRIREFRRQQKDTLLRYKTIFNTALSDMIFYNTKGVLTNLNKKACETFGQSFNEMTDGTHTMEEFLEGKDLRSFEKFHATQLPDSPDGIYYEVQVVPIRDKHNKPVGFFRTGRDMTEVVQFNRQLKQGSLDQAHANKHLREYVYNINYVLKVGGVRIAVYSPKDHILSIYEDTNNVKFRLTQTRCMNLVDEHSKRTATRIMNSMDNLVNKNIDAHVRTILKTKDQLPLQLQLQFHPTLNERGEVTSYFGLCRDESELMSKEQQLEQESQKAQEVEHVKNVFLRNMSYEIRTPLTSVVGFSELLEHQDFEEDANMFITQIKDNSTHLLSLINDILYLSRLDAHMIEFKKQPTDFANTFNAYCENGWRDNKKEGVKYVVENNFNKMVVEIDDAHLGNIIEQVTANAAQNTEKGSVVARYDYFNNELVIEISDTGHGISKEDQEHIFERFIASRKGGTGLGLPICKQLAEQMGGTININSELNRGTTVWITIPCKAFETDRKESI